jgi:NADH dehydrogenase (ubiquinone) 1 alpha subcomplex subunit 6
MYTLNVPVSAIRTKIRQQFEKHRYASQINVVDVLLYKSHAEFQVRFLSL